MLITAGTSRSAHLAIAPPRRLPVALAIAAGALVPTKGTLILTVLAALTKTATVVMIVWAVTHPHSPIGPHGAVDWVPLGMLNAATGLWLLAVIRHRAR